MIREGFYAVVKQQCWVPKLGIAEGKGEGRFGGSVVLQEWQRIYISGGKKIKHVFLKRSKNSIFKKKLKYIEKCIETNVTGERPRAAVLRAGEARRSGTQPHYRACSRSCCWLRCRSCSFSQPHSGSFSRFRSHSCSFSRSLSRSLTEAAPPHEGRKGAPRSDHAPRAPRR